MTSKQLCVIILIISSLNTTIVAVSAYWAFQYFHETKSKIDNVIDRVQDIVENPHILLSNKNNVSEGKGDVMMDIFAKVLN